MQPLAHLLGARPLLLVAECERLKESAVGDVVTQAVVLKAEHLVLALRKAAREQRIFDELRHFLSAQPAPCRGERGEQTPGLGLLREQLAGVDEEWDAVAQKDALHLRLVALDVGQHHLEIAVTCAVRDFCDDLAGEELYLLRARLGGDQPHFAPIFHPLLGQLVGEQGAGDGVQRGMQRLAVMSLLPSSASGEQPLCRAVAIYPLVGIAFAAHHTDGERERGLGKPAQNVEFRRLEIVKIHHIEMRGDGFALGEQRGECLQTGGGIAVSVSESGYVALIDQRHVRQFPLDVGGGAEGGGAQTFRGETAVAHGSERGIKLLRKSRRARGFGVVGQFAAILLYHLREQHDGALRREALFDASAHRLFRKAGEGSHSDIEKSLLSESGDDPPL